MYLLGRALSKQLPKETIKIISTTEWKLTKINDKIKYEPCIPVPEQQLRSSHVGDDKQQALLQEGLRECFFQKSEKL